MAEKDLTCPNCGPGTKTHPTAKGIVCEACGGTFTYAAGEAKLTGIGELDKLKADVEELKKRLPASSPAAPPAKPGEEPEEGDELGDEEEDDH